MEEKLGGEDTEKFGWKLEAQERREERGWVTEQSEVERRKKRER